MVYNGLSPTINCMLLKYGMIKQTRKCVNTMRHTAARGAARSKGIGIWFWDSQTGAGSGGSFRSSQKILAIGRRLGTLLEQHFH
jgi:endonuclease YncB( thermonuclease family)